MKKPKRRKAKKKGKSERERNQTLIRQEQYSVTNSLFQKKICQVFEKKAF
jgi:hypothetical protein